MLLESDANEIKDLIKDGLSIRAIAGKFDVPESTLRYFINKNRIDVSGQPTQKVRNNYAQFAGMPVFDSPLPITQHIQVPNSTDPQVLSYMLQLKSLEAKTANDRLSELEIEHRRLRSDYTDLEIKQKHFDREKQLAVEDAVRDNHKGKFDAEKALTIVSSSPVLSNALAGVLSKVMNIDNPAGQLGAAPQIENPAVMELAKFLATKDTDTINQVVAVAFRMADDKVWLAQAFQAVAN